VTNVGPHLAPPPGWYADPTGTPRWWDGWQWGPAASQRSEEAEGKTVALISHLGIITAGPLLPLVLRLTEGRKNAFVRHHSTEALNFQITFVLVWVLGFVLLSTTSLGTPKHGTAAPAGVFAVFGVMMATYVLGIICSILGCVRASHEEWWRYPVSIRFVPGARRRQSS
jgi:uncharacterized Tic20 family protein